LLSAIGDGQQGLAPAGEYVAALPKAEHTPAPASQFAAASENENGAAPTCVGIDNFVAS
jgi:hypothetical protein